MDNTLKYGQLDSERKAEENKTCRQIVSEINHFGVSERQKLFIIYLLALELEDNDRLLAITSIAKESDNSMLLMTQDE